MSKAGLLAEHRALSLPRRPHRAAACSQPIAVVAFGFWVTPFEFRVSQIHFSVLTFVVELLNRPRLDKVLQKDL
jgi:hypothetical protein